ncbi:MAG: transcription initiation factor IIB, partial [Thaumarchaeota archaeon]|nr:transcription initiation factor IIB [Nitrososphaerota archaeon]
MIIENAEESRPERRLFLNESDNSRTGIPNSLAIHDRGLATLIGNTSKDSTGKSLSPTMRKDIERLRIWDARSKTKNNEKNLRSAFIELDKLKDKLTLS